MTKKTVETRRKEPRADRDGRQYVAVHRNYLGLVDPIANGEYLAQVWQCCDGRLVSVARAAFLLQRKANTLVRDSVGPGKTRAAMTAQQHAERLGWIEKEPEGMALYVQRVSLQARLAEHPEDVHKVVVRLCLLLDDDDLEAVASRGFSDRRRAKLSEVKRWAEVTLLGQLQLACERRAAELAGERTGRA